MIEYHGFSGKLTFSMYIKIFSGGSDVKEAVFILSKEGCSKCEEAKKFFMEQNRAVINIPIETLSKEAKKSIVSIRQAFGVKEIDLPVIIDAKIYSGFKKEDWE
ncbi:MAG: hypothetical protein EOM23_03510 [Candidatus Moranbacteria bacterium]|nr:hypothetical protein [Candidatus Moranbacteria bacterium]